jgi:hypothetical protein
VTTAIGGGFIASPESASRRGFIDLLRRVKALEDAAEAATSGALGEVAYAQVTSDPAGGIASSYSDISGLSVTFTPTVGRRYKVTGAMRASQATAQGIQEMAVRNGSTVLNNTTMTVDLNEIGYHTVHYVFTEASGSSITLKLSLLTTAGTADPFASATQIAFILVEDIGTEADGAYLLTEGGDYITAEDGTKLTTE